MGEGGFGWYRASDSFRGRIGIYDAWGPFVSLLSPSGNEALKGGSERYITWTSQQIDTIRIEYSLDGGAHWQTVAESVKASEQRFLWTVPDVGSNACQMRLIDTADSRNTSETGTFMIVVLTGVEDAQDGSPRSLFAISNHPNPFNPSTAISFSLPQSGKATLTVYDITGRKVRTLATGHMTAGTHSMIWDGRDDSGKPVSSGVYLSRLESGEAAHTAKMLLLK